ncbi:MAG: hypothetical protein NVS2B16_29740 [Chloroflexota bacterium]
MAEDRLEMTEQELVGLTLKLRRFSSELTGKECDFLEATIAAGIEHMSEHDVVGHGQVTFTLFTLTKKIDKASPVLFASAGPQNPSGLAALQGGVPETNH